MVARFRDEGCLEEKEVVLCAIMNSIPVYFRELFTYQIPIVLPALGLVVGGFYAIVFIITALVKISVVVILSRLFLKEGRCRVPEGSSQERVSLKEAVIRSFRRERSSSPSGTGGLSTPSASSPWRRSSASRRRASSPSRPTLRAPSSGYPSSVR
jgi:hypothetical protein